MRRLILRMIVLCALGSPTISAAQAANEIVTHIVDSDDGMTDESDLNRLDWLRQNPIDLNRCDAQELSQLPWITIAQARAIISYRQEHGPYSRISEFSSVAGLDRDIFRRIKPFVVASDSRRMWSGRWRVVTRQRENGNQAEPGQNSVQLNATAGTHARLGLHIAHLPHQSEFQPKGGYLDISTGGIVQRIVLGGYALEYGQGLILGPSSHRRIDGIGSRVKWRGRGLVTSTGGARGARYTGFAMSMGREQTTGAVFVGRLPQEGSIMGSRLERVFNNTKLGVSAVRTIDTDTENIRGAFDFEVPISGMTVFGEVVPIQHGGTELRLGQSWQAGPIDGGLQLGLLRAAVSTVGSRIRYKPNPRFILVFATDQRLPNSGAFKRHVNSFTLSNRSKPTRMLTLVSLWQRERRDLFMEPASRTRGMMQLDCELRRSTRIRVRLDRRSYGRQLSLKRHRDLIGFIEFRYRPISGHTFSLRWSESSRIDTEGRAEQTDDEWAQERRSRGRLTAYVTGRIHSGVNWSLRYAQTRDLGATRLEKTGTNWQIQLEGEW